MKNSGIFHIEPFTGKAAEWLRDYLENTHVDPEEQEKVNQRIRKNASRAVKGGNLR